MSDINISFNFYDDSDANFYIDGNDENANYLESADDVYYYEDDEEDEDEEETGWTDEDEEDDYEYVYDDYSEEWVFWDDL